jgi:hypothetical protein
MSQLKVREPRVVADRAERGLVRERATRRGLVYVAVVVVALALLVFIFDLSSRHIFGGNSDDATLVLQGQSVAAGHAALQGWDLSYDSFWTVDVIFYAVAVRLLGVGPDLMNLVPAVIAGSLVLVAAMLTRQGRTDRGFLAGAALVGALLALPGPELAFFLLQGGWHAATTLWCLLTFAAVSRSSSRWSLAAAVVLVATGLLGDLLTLTLVVVPLIVGAALGWRRSRSWRAASRPLIAAVAGGALALGVRAIAVASGAYSIGSRSILAPHLQIVLNLRAIPFRLAELFGVTIKVPGLARTPLALRAVHVVLMLVVVIALGAGLARIARSLFAHRPYAVAERDSVAFEELLVIAFVTDLASFAVFSTYGAVDFTRYLVPGFVFLVVLAARLVARAVRSRPSLEPRVLAGVAIVVIGLCAVNFGADSIGPAAPQEARALGTFLSSRGLRSGVGDYWSSSIVTVDTGDEVKVRPVAIGPSGTLQRYTLQSAASWYQGRTFRFFVYDSGNIWQNVTAAAAMKTFGAPSATYDVGSYRVLTYPGGIHVSS